MKIAFDASPFVEKRLEELFQNCIEDGIFIPGEMDEEEYKESMVNYILELALDKTRGIV